MSVHGWIKMALVYDGIIIGHGKEGSHATCNDLHEPGEYYAKLKGQMEKDNTAWNHVYVETDFKKKKEFLETESKWWLPRAGAGRNRTGWSRRQFQLLVNQVFIRTCNIWSFNVQWVIIVNNTEIC